MAKWFQSGRRRDLSVILAGEGELSGQKLKTRLERRYDERIEPRSFYGALSSMKDAGFVETRTEGVADLYSLTEAGKERVREQFEWMREHVEE
ncbi:PadR family transcriptional regulator [Halomicrobium urmianum]|uniref:PadR family transcriptional regulator n=1 Tax=Halomicrobium urmianum TaxID=1586233 RepID=UPI001CDA53C5|nr:PadR family transcriptional regulator [Halomicrobium urmianum]